MIINTSSLRKLNALCWIFHHIGLKMEGVVVVVYYDGDVVSTTEGVLFKCPNGHKFIKKKGNVACCFEKCSYRFQQRWKKLI